MAQHRIQLDDRGILEVSGVKNVLSFDEELVVLDTLMGQLHITGEGLHITTLTLNDSKVALEGTNITGLEYRESMSGQVKNRSQNFLRRILK